MSFVRKSALKWGVLPALLGLAIVGGVASPASAVLVGGSRTCSAPKSVALWSDQVGPGYHYYNATAQLYYTSQPSGARGQFQTYGAAASTSYSIQADGGFYSQGATCY